VAGRLYYILAGGFGGASGTLQILAELANDRCAWALPLVNGYPYTISTVDASATEDPTPGCQGNFGKGMWFSFTAPGNGAVRVSTCGSSFDTALEVYTGDCGALTPLDGGCNDDNGPDCTALQASVDFMAAAGTVYRILVGGFAGASGSLTVGVRDLEPPQVTCPANLVVVADAGQCTKSNVSYTATATDNFPGVIVGCDPPSGTTFPVGNTTVTCTAIDAAGNVAQCTFTVTVRDTQPPQVTCPADITVNADPGQCWAVVNFTSTASDNCSLAAFFCDPPSGSAFPVGTNTVTCTAVDPAEHISRCTFKVTVQDQEPPTLLCPEIVANADPGQCSKNNVTYRVTAMDNCPGLTVTYTPPDGSRFPVGVSTVNCLAVDTAGNRNQCSFTVTIHDVEPPEITCPLDITTNTAPGQCAQVVYFNPTVTDKCDPNPTVECSPPSGTAFPVGVTRVHCVATDASGNTAACDFDVTVSLGGAPEVITFEENIPSPNSVIDQYCNNPATSKGVRFVDVAGRVFTPSVQTASPSKALYNHLGGSEFDVYDKLKISFTTGQCVVGMRVGLDQASSFPVTATLYGYRSETPGTDLLAIASVGLGTGPTPITNLVFVSSAAGELHSVILEFHGVTSSQAAIEVIDDLMFSHVGPPCVIDTQSPTVQITQPATDGTRVYESTDLAFAAQDLESGVARLKVSYLNSAGGTLSSFDTCGSGQSPSCPLPGNSVSYDFQTWLPADTAKIRVTAWDYAGHTGSAERKVYLDPLGPNLNLYVMGMEVTQGIQPWVPTASVTRRTGLPLSFTYPDPPDTVPLVANRTTVVRLYVGVEGIKPDQKVDMVRAWLRCYKNSAFTQFMPAYPILAPVNGMATLRPTNTFASLREDTNDTFTFVLPAAWTQPGTIYLEAEIDVIGAAQECAGCVDAANRMRIGTLQFQTVPDFTSLHELYGVTTPINGQSTSPNAAQVTAGLNFVRKVYPVDDSTVPTAVQQTWVYGKQVVWTNCGGPLDDFTKAFKAAAQGRRVVYGAMFPKGIPCAGIGWGGFCIWQIGFDPHNLNSAPHEMGHGWKLNHPGPAPGHGAECGSGGWCDTDWPWPHGTYVGYGFDILDLKAIPPGTGETNNHDLMSYGGVDPNWISSRNWIRLFNAFTGKNLAYPKGAPVEFAACLIVSGAWSDATGWGFTPVYELAETMSFADDEPAGDHAIELRRADGQPILRRRFSIPSTHVDCKECAEPMPVSPSFVQLMPEPETAATIVLFGPGGVQLAQLRRSPSAPQLSITSPTASGFATGGEGPYIGWSASDPDAGDALHFLVQYRRTATAPWQTLAVDMSGGSLAVAPDDLPGGPDPRVRVFATDGFNTTGVTSPAFAVADKPPLLTILSPPNDTTVTRQDTILLRGAGSDPEDGVLPAASLAWTSSLDGPLGTGHRIEATKLSLGSHQITLTGLDEAGHSGTATITLNILKGVNTQPIANAGPDQAALVQSAVVLDGSASADPDDDPLTYSWIVTSEPPGSHPVLLNSGTAQPSFSADVIGAYELQLVVHDGEIASLPDPTVVTVTRQSCVVVASAGAHGHVEPSGQVPLACGGTVKFTLVGDPLYHVATVFTNGVAVPGVGGSRSNQFVWATIPPGGVLTAEFEADRAARGTPEWWLAQHGLTNDSPDHEELTDSDGDGLAAWQEFVADTNPNQADSVLAVTALGLVGQQVRIEWKGGREALQFLERRSALDLASSSEPWTVVFTNRPPTAPQTNVLDTLSSGEARFYRLRAIRP